MDDKFSEKSYHDHKNGWTEVSKYFTISKHSELEKKTRIVTIYFQIK